MGFPDSIRTAAATWRSGPESTRKPGGLALLSPPLPAQARSRGLLLLLLPPPGSRAPTSARRRELGATGAGAGRVGRRSRAGGETRPAPRAQQNPGRAGETARLCPKAESLPGRTDSGREGVKICSH
ncbi:Hypothetical predicted protein [Podarcis lilfordi]|uniref:Uncharacterized protein n=1 Tax=Podarcis lilfordi TaxID=74358 RepID=A0AA35LAX1_9SAUR|nr:Hypothetical predicted protein [Podarcis lilfordi]